MFRFNFHALAIFDLSFAFQLTEIKKTQNLSDLNEYNNILFYILI